MRIFVSSTSRDLAEYRAAAIRGLRRLGHTVVAMEDFTAAPAYPLSRVVELVRASDAYVVIVAWRYGFPPVTEDVADLPVVPAGRAGISITEWEYLAAKEDPDRPILPFLLAETAPWQPQDIDGFDDHHGADTTIDQVRTFRATLAREHIVSFFSRPDELEALVTAAVTSARLARGVFLNQFSLGTPIQGPETTPDASYPGRIVDIVRHRGGESVAHVNIASPWWSTRLYLLAFLLDRLTATRRILVTDDAEFVGLLPLGAVLRGMAALHDRIREFETAERRRAQTEPDVVREAEALVELFQSCFRPRGPDGQASPAAGPSPESVEASTKVDVTKANLRRWFEDSLVTSPIHLESTTRARPLDLVRLFDFPGDFVPITVVERAAQKDVVKYHVIDKRALSLQLAKAYVTELLDESG
ncbi:MAG: DUF4062 domain-containing protein [Kineosporiaceae bacterium]|nr:DUF4062 domain-containing protein [Kineosporiaceae bacterium]